MANRVQVTAYLTDKKHIDTWDRIKKHYGESSDSAVVRRVIEDIGALLDTGGLDQPEPNTFHARLIALERRIEQIESTK